MPLFLILGHDKADALPRRMAVRPAHLDYVRALGDAVKVAGPLLGEDGERIAGSAFVMDLPDRAAAERIVAEDPYAGADVFEKVTITPFRALIGSWAATQ